MAITRRALLKGAAAAAAAAVPLAPAHAFAHGEGEEAEEEEAHGHEQGEASARIRRWAMVIDLRACDGCEGLGVPPQCTQACNWSRFVPEGQQWIEVYEPAAGHLPEGGNHFLPAPCMQCQNAPCVNVCPVGASFHTPEGVVLIDQERCIGCRLCMAACPYDRRFFNWGDPVQPAMVQQVPYDVRTQLPAMRGTVMKCDFCMDRTSAGGLPACVEGCPRGAMYMADLEEGIATNGRQVVEVAELLEQDGVQRYKEELGTEPRVYFIPGHGEDAPFDEGAEEKGFARSELPRFRKDALEWPWREMNAFVASVAPSQEEDRDG
jgi:molybdopterin-containing oxidoreductase family iron-sulfur binding subunit